MSAKDLIKMGLLGKKNPLIFRDEFSDNQAAGSVNGTHSTDGSEFRHVYDPDSILSNASGQLKAAGTSGTSADFRPGFWYDAYPRPSVIIADVVLSSTVRGPDYIGWYVTPEKSEAGIAGYERGNGYSARVVTNYALYAGYFLTNSSKLATLAAGTYKIAVCALLDRNELWIKGGAYTTWTKVHTDTTVIEKFMYPAISHYVGGTATDDKVDNFSVGRFTGYNFDKYGVRGTGRNSVSVVLFGDSKSANRHVPKSGNTHNFYFNEIPNALAPQGVTTGRIATAGATMATRTSSIVADLAAITTGTPQYILWNIGANDTDSMPSEATFKANAQTCIDAIHAKWDSAKIYFMRVFVKSKAAECANIAQWYADLVTANPGVCFLGPDERVFLENGDDGATYMADDRHPNVAGYIVEFANWRSSLGY